MNAETLRTVIVVDEPQRAGLIAQLVRETYGPDVEIHEVHVERLLASDPKGWKFRPEQVAAAESKIRDIKPQLVVAQHETIPVFGAQHDLKGNAVYVYVDAKDKELANRPPPFHHKTSWTPGLMAEPLEPQTLIRAVGASTPWHNWLPVLEVS